MDDHCHCSHWHCLCSLNGKQSFLLTPTVMLCPQTPCHYPFSEIWNITLSSQWHDEQKERKSQISSAESCLVRLTWMKTFLSSSLLNPAGRGWRAAQTRSERCPEYHWADAGPAPGLLPSPSTGRHTEESMFSICADGLLTKMRLLAEKYWIPVHVSATASDCPPAHYYGCQLQREEHKLSLLSVPVQAIIHITTALKHWKMRITSLQI